MYYLLSRYYDPAIGRFINADSYASTGQGFLGTNMFAYCNNNPTIFLDSCGKSLATNVMMTDSGAKTKEQEAFYEFMSICAANNIQTYASADAAAKAWANENRSKSENKECMSFIYKEYGRYFYTSVYTGMGEIGQFQPNVIIPLLLQEAKRRLIGDYSVHAMIHSHPNPGHGYHNDYPSMDAGAKGGDRIAFKIFGYQEMYIVPFTNCSNNCNSISKITDSSTWCPRNPFTN